MGNNQAVPVGGGMSLDEPEEVLPVLRNNTRRVSLPASDDQVGSTLMSRRTLRLASRATLSAHGSSFARFAGAGGARDAEQQDPAQAESKPPVLLRKAQERRKVCTDARNIGIGDASA